MKSDRVPVAIVGGGFSGTMLAVQLVRRGIASVLIEGHGRVGRGTAYSTDEPSHLLNVRAEGMSAWPDRPDDFADAFEAAGGHRKGFAERRLFGRYLGSILDEVRDRVEILTAMAVSALPHDDGWRLTLNDKSSLDASALVLANGNQAPEPLAVAAAAGPRFINNPWGTEARRAVRLAAENDGAVLLIGTGLTMIDMVLSLDAAGHRGRITALSRRGLIPKAHADFTSAPVERGEPPSGNVRVLWRWLRRRGGEVGWRAAVDSLRPHSQALWQSLDVGQQRRFLRHARPWWDVHRHRIAPDVSRQLAGLVAGGRLEIIAGKVAEMGSANDGIAALIRRRGHDRAKEYPFAFAFNCTGPLGAIERTCDPLLRQLLDSELVKADHLGMGLDVDERSRATTAKLLWALGPLTKGRYWEIVAVPDIRGQAAAVAEDIAMELGQ